jgi:hypothetical protein
VSLVSRVRDAALLLGFVLSLLAVLVTPRCTRDRVPDAARWLPIVQQSADALTPGTVVLVHPPWRDDVVEAIRAANVLPAGVSVTAAIAPRHGEALPPLVILREQDGVTLPHNLRTATREAALDGVELWRLARTAPSRAGARELTDELALAQVQVTTPDRTTVCSWDSLGERHTCPELPEWMYVGAQALPVGGKSERCAWAHPITGGELSIAFPASNARAPLLLSLALTDTAADNKTGAEVTAALFADDVEIARLSRQGQRGFARTRIERIPEDTQHVRVVITAQNDGQRHTCFRLTSGGAP